MGKRNKVTTRDIAQATNVSQSTVSMILSENKNVSFKEETVNLVKKTAKQMGYKKPEVKKKVFKRKKYDCRDLFLVFQFVLCYGCFPYD